MHHANLRTALTLIVAAGLAAGCSSQPDSAASEDTPPQQATA